MLLPRLLPLILVSSLSFLSAEAAFRTVNFRARPGGNFDSSTALLEAWSSACSSPVPTIIIVPAGRFLLKPVALNGPCKRLVTLQIYGTFVAPSTLGGSSKWITVNDVTGLKINGGTLDGNGRSFWACKRSGRSCPPGSNSLVIESSRDVEIVGLSSINSKIFHFSVHKSVNVAIRGAKIIAPADSPNTDGIHVEMSRGITITGSSIQTGDDCISIGPGSTNVWVERVSCGPGHGISIGSLGRSGKEEGVKNITVLTTHFSGTQNGLRIKAWARASTGFVSDVSFGHAVMRNVANPIIIDQHYCPRSYGCPSQASGIKISKVAFSDIKGTSATKVAVLLDCSSRNPCAGISLRDIKLTYEGKTAQSICRHAEGTTMGVVDPPGCF